MNKKVLLYILLFAITAISFAVYALDDISQKEDSPIKSPVSSPKIYEHTFPERVTKNDYFKGEFISNDIASVYPRRDALVRDILVDIGDKVFEGQTLALLFNPGVNGESQSKISIKDTMVSTKHQLMNDLKNIKNAKIAELDQKITEQETILRETTLNFDSKIALIGNNTKDDNALGSEYQVQLKALENMQKNLENATSSKEELLLESTKNIEQKEQLLSSKIDEYFYKIIPMLYFGTERDTDYININSSDFSDLFGAKDSRSKNEFISKITVFHKNYGTIELNQKYNDFLELNTLFVSVLKNTITGVQTPEITLADYISQAHTFNTSLISQKEMLDDAQNMFRILESGQKEKIENIEKQITQKENDILLLQSKSKVIESDKSFGIAKLQASIETLKRSRDLLIATENKNITSLQNEIAISQADLNSEYIKSGDYKIVSPFTGVISKRSIELGDKISPNMEAFRLTGVQNTLSKITKKEVKFYVPENGKDNLVLGKEISFFLGNDQEKSFTGSIYRIAPEIDENNLSITVQAKVDDNIGLPNKSTVRVTLETQNESFRIPGTAIYNKDERKIVYYKKENGKLGIKDINIISNDGEFSLVSGDFDETLKVVITPIFIK